MRMDTRHAGLSSPNQALHLTGAALPFSDIRTLAAAPPGELGRYAAEATPVADD
jgi:hypothetical protein